MSHVVYKYNFRLADERSMDPPYYTYRAQAYGTFSVSMPDGATILGIQEWRQEIAMWALVDKKQPHRPYRFFYVGTAQHIPAEYVPHLSYVATLPLLGGNAIYHFFRVADNFQPTESV